MLKAVTFDFWNTLYGEPEGRATLDLRIQGLRDILVREGFDLEPEQVVDVVREAWGEAWRQQRFNGRDIGPWGQVRFIAKRLGIESDSIIEDIYEAYSGVLLISPPAMRPGVPEALRAMQGRVRMAVICNTGSSPGTVLRQLMCEDQILQYFDFLTFSDEVGVAKPNPGIFKHTLRQLSVSPGDALHVGDDGITDIIGAKRAGLFAVWVNPDAEWPLPECDWHIKSMEELPTIVDELQGDGR